MKVATYSRVSTARSDQKPEVQGEELRRYCQARGFEITHEIADRATGTTDQRPGLKRLLELARTRKIDAVAVAKLDRLFRSLKHLLDTLAEFEALGVKVIATHDQVAPPMAEVRVIAPARFSFRVLSDWSVVHRDDALYYKLTQYNKSLTLRAMKLTRLGWLPVLVLALSGSYTLRTAAAATKKTEALLYNWLKEDESFSPKKLQTLLDLAARDTQSAALIRTAMARVGAKNAEELARMITVDQPGTSDGSVANHKGGEFRAGEHQVKTIELAPEDWYSEQDLATRDPYRGQIEAFRAANHAYLAYAENRGVYLELHSFSGPSVYVARDGNLGQTYECFMHELTHFVDFDLRQEPDALQFDDSRAFSDAYLLSPGQEVPARIAGLQALTRLADEVPYYSSFPVDLEQWLTRKGALLKAPTDFLGVVTGFLAYSVEDLFRNRVEVAAATADDEYRAIQRNGGCAAISAEASTAVARCKARVSELLQRTTRASEILNRLGQ